MLYRPRVWHWLGERTTRHAGAILIGWVVCCAALLLLAPSFASQVTHGEFNFLPADLPSRRAIDLYGRAFATPERRERDALAPVDESPARRDAQEMGEGPIRTPSAPTDRLETDSLDEPSDDPAAAMDALAATADDEAAPTDGDDTTSDASASDRDVAQDDDAPQSVQQNPLGSNIVLLLRRATPLRDADREFLDQTLIPRIREIAAETEASSEGVGARRPEITSIWTYSDGKFGPLLVSTDGHAMMVVIELDTEFLDRSNAPLVSELQTLVANVSELPAYPTGLDLKISGSATVGRDMLVAEREGASRTEVFTLVLVIGLLSLIYRAPVLALIPLATVAAASVVALRLLAVLAGLEVSGIFSGLETYIRVVMYGAGVDYALFILARYREELDDGTDYPSAVAASVRKIGPALATSAGTSIVGIAMMCFASFGKFRQSGFGISFGLLIVLIAALTFTPAVLRLFGRYAFWPRIRTEEVSTSRAGGRTRSSLRDLINGRSVQLIRERYRLRDLWNRIGQRIAARPLTWLGLSLAAMLPLVVVGVTNFDHLSYGLLSDLPADEPSVVGAKAIQEHFPAGVAGPTSVLIAHPALADERSLNVSRDVTERLTSEKGRLRLADVRSEADPLGTSEQAQRYLTELDGTDGSKGSMNRLFVRKQLRAQARRLYSAQSAELDGQVVRVDLVFNADPFDRDSIDLLNASETVIRGALPESIREGAEILMIGPTASIRDLKSVTDGDRIRICSLVSIAVYLVIVALLRQPRICLFLIVSVVLSYLATVGLTHLAFAAWEGDAFAGLDWKVPIFLFTLLIALGEDYNILLMARVVEEQRTHGVRQGVLEALARTGSIISSCGVIMAGTFASLLFGTLTSMLQMGFALTVGVMMDTFLVRPVIVPAWLMTLYDWQLAGGWKARLATLLGGGEMMAPAGPAPDPPEPAVVEDVVGSAP